MNGDVALLREVVDQLANALQTAIGLTAALRRTTQTTADDAAALEGSLDRAVRALRRLQTRTSEESQ